MPNEGRIRPSLIAAGYSYLRRGSPDFPTRGEFAPPSLRRIRFCGGRRRRCCQRGANSPLPHCGTEQERQAERDRLANEGRIRPSLIAALPPPLPLHRHLAQRGANSPLPHCGLEEEQARAEGGAEPTRGEFAPPSLRRGRDYRGGACPGDQRGANSPLPHCGVNDWACPRAVMSPTRGEFAPPSLRRAVWRRRASAEPTNEGRIRPSLIAAGGAGAGLLVDASQRGANSPLPHCGRGFPRGNGAAPVPTRGEFAPPSLRHRIPGGE